MTHTTMRAMVIEKTGGPEELIAADVPWPCRVGSDVLVKVHRRGRQPARREDPGRPRPTAAPSVPPGGARQRLQRRRRREPLRGAPAAPGDEVYGMCRVPRYARHVRRVRQRPELSLARKPVGALARRGGRGAARRAHGLGHGRRGRQGARGPAHPHPRRGGRGRSLRRAVRRLLRRSRDRDRLDPQHAAGCASSAPTRSSTTPTERFEERAVRRRRRDRPRRQRARRHGLPLTVGAAPRRARSSTRRPAAGRRSSRRPRPRGCAPPRFRVAPDGATLAVISRLLESGDVRVFVDEVFDLLEAADAAHAQLETGHTRGKLVLTRRRGLTASASREMPLVHATRRVGRAQVALRRRADSEQGALADEVVLEAAADAEVLGADPLEAVLLVEAAARARSAG